LLATIALLVSAGVLAFAEEPIDTNDVEEVVLNGEPTNDTPAAEPAPEAAQAAEEPSNDGSSNEELPTQEATSVQGEPSVQEEAPAPEATTGNTEADPVPSYNNETPAEQQSPTDDTPAEGQLPADDISTEQQPSEDDSSAEGQLPVDDTPILEDTPDDSGDGVIVTFDEETGEKIYTDDEGTYFEDELTTFVDGDNGGSDDETIAAMGLEVTDEVKFADATWLSLNDRCEGNVNPENKAEFVIKWESGQSIVLGLEASSSDLDVAINGTDIKFEETESDENQSGFAGTYKLNIVADTAYYIVLSSQSSVDYILTVKDAFVVAAEENNDTEETKAEDSAEVNNSEETVENNSEENTEDNNNNEKTPAEDDEGTEKNIEGNKEDNNNNEVTPAEEGKGTEGKVEGNNEDNNNNEETPAEEGKGTEGKVEGNNEDNNDNEETPAEEGEGDEEGNEEDNNNEETPDEEGDKDNNDEYNTDNETIVNEFPVIRGWITIDTEAFDVGSTITLKANTDPELDGTAAWQTKVQNEKGEEAWEICGYGETLTIKLTKDNINSTYRFKMEGENYSEEYTLGSIREEDEENEKVIDATEDEETEDETVKMSDQGYTKVIVTAEEGANLFADTNKESEVLGHLDTETEIWVLMNEDQTWGRIYEETEDKDIEQTKEVTEETTENVVPVKYISMEDAEIVKAETEEDKDEAEATEEVVEDETVKMTKLGYTKIVVTAEGGADLFADTNKESEVLGHMDAKAETWVLLNKDKTWGQLYTEPAAEVEETVDAEEGEAVEEDAETVTTSAQFICMEDAAETTAAEKETEETEETEQVEDLTEEGDEETAKMTELGYIKIIVAAEEGADLYAAADRGSEVTGHLDPETEAWVLLNEDKTWGQLYVEQVIAEAEILDTEAAKEATETAEAAESPAQYICIEDAITNESIVPIETMYEIKGVTIVVVDETGSEEPVERNFRTFSSLDLEGFIEFGTVVMTQIQSNTIAADEVCSYQWFYSEDGGQNWNEIEDATGNTCNYELTFNSWLYQWKVVVTISK